MITKEQEATIDRLERKGFEVEVNRSIGTAFVCVADVWISIERNGKLAGASRGVAVSRL